MNISHYKDPAGIEKPNKYNLVGGQTVLDWLIETFPSQDDLCGELACSFILNGKEIFRSDHEELDHSRLDFCLSKFDQLKIVNRPAGLETATLVYIAIGVSVASVAYSIYTMSKLPGAAGTGAESPNNLLNAASNEFRPGEAIPENFGYGVAYPDFIQPSYYYYENNVKKQVSLLCVGVGNYNIQEVRIGETNLDNINSSFKTIYQPFDPIDQEELQIHSAAANVDGQTLLAPNDPSIYKTNVDVVLLTDTKTPGNYMSITGSTADLNDLAIEVGGWLYLRSLVRDGNSLPPVYIDTMNGVFAISNITTSEDGLTRTIDITGFNEASWDLSWYTGTVDVGMDVQALSIGIGNGEGVTGQGFDGEFGTVIGWFALPNDSCSKVLIHWNAPYGIRSSSGGSMSIDMLFEARNDDTGEIFEINQNITKNTLTAQYNTTEFSADTIAGFTEGAYSVRAKRLSDIQLNSSSASTIIIEAFVGVSLYSVSDFGNTTCIKINRTANVSSGDQAGSKINCDYRRLLPIYNRESGEYDTSSLSETNSFADAVAYMLIVASEKERSTVDLESLYSIMDSLSEHEYGEFTFTFDDADVSLGERIETACNVARVTAFHDGVKWRFSRDERKIVRSAMFNRRSLVSNNAKQSWQPQRDDDADSVLVYYTDPDDNTEETVKRRLDTTTGTVINGEVGSNVVEIKLAGCRNITQATDRADLEVRRLAYQRRTVSDKTRRDALEVDLLDRVAWVDINDSETFDGEILAVSGDDGNLFDTSERFTPISGEQYVVFITDKDGYPSNTTQCYARSDTEFGFDAADLSDVYVADAMSQVGSRYLIANASDLNASDFTFKSATPNADGTVQIELAEYRDEMYEMDP